VTSDAGIVDEDVHLAKGFEDGPDKHLGRRLIPGIGLHSKGAAANRLDVSRGFGCGGGVAAVAECDVRALGCQAQDDGTTDPSCATGDERNLAREIDHAWTSRWAERACSGSPGTTSSSGTSMDPGRRISSARASGIGSTESQSTGRRTLTSDGWTAA